MRCALEKAASVWLFDWDDTLMPTSAVGGDIFEGELCSDLLCDVDDAAARCLSTALAMPRSHVILLTNAAEAWVWTSAKHMPRVHEILLSGRISLVSAHRPFSKVSGETHEATAYRQMLHAAASTDWKDVAVRERIAAPLCHALGAMQPHLVQVVTVGDKAHDMEAGHTLAGLFRNAVQQVNVETVRMQEMPTIPVLVDELSALANSLEVLCTSSSDVDCGCHVRTTGPARSLRVQAEEAWAAAERARQLIERTRHLSYDAKRLVTPRTHNIEDGVKSSLPLKRLGQLYRSRLPLLQFGSE